MNRLLIILLLCAEYVSAQSNVFTLLNRNQYLARVKMIDEFFKRFNGEEMRSDVGSEYSDRASGIILLFDLAKYNSKTDSGFVSSETFSKFVAEKEVKLNFEDYNWYAKIKCHAKLAQKNVVFDMYLCVEERDSAMYRWAIGNVDGELFLTSRDKPHNEFFYHAK